MTDPTAPVPAGASAPARPKWTEIGGFVWGAVAAATALGGVVSYFSRGDEKVDQRLGALERDVGIIKSDWRVDHDSLTAIKSDVAYLAQRARDEDLANQRRRP